MVVSEMEKWLITFAVIAGGSLFFWLCCEIIFRSHPPKDHFRRRGFV